MQSIIQNTNSHATCEAFSSYPMQEESKSDMSYTTSLDSFTSQDHGNKTAGSFNEPVFRSAMEAYVPKVFLPLPIWMDQTSFLSSAEPDVIIAALEYMLAGDNRIRFITSERTHSIQGTVSQYSSDQQFASFNNVDNSDDGFDDVNFAFCISVYDRSNSKSTATQRQQNPSLYGNNSHVEFHRTQGSTVDFQRFFQDCMLCIGNDVIPTPPSYCKFSEIVKLNHWPNSAIEGDHAATIPRIMSFAKLQQLSFAFAGSQSETAADDSSHFDL